MSAFGDKADIETGFAIPTITVQEKVRMGDEGKAVSFPILPTALLFEQHSSG